MSLDANPVRLTATGQLLITRDGKVEISDFAGDGCSCRDVAALALVWAIGLLQAELMKALEAPGRSEVVVD